MSLQEKKDITRLKNLLRDYRDHMITRYKVKCTHYDIVEIINEIDNSIKTINFCLK